MAKTIVQLRCLEAPVTYAEATVQYDPWGAPYVKAALRGYFTPWTMLLKPGGKVDDPLYTTEWRVKSGPPVDFPENVSERQALGWFPSEVK